MNLTVDERNLIIQALYMRKNYIETRDPTLSSADLQNMKRNAEIRALTTEQMRTIITVEDLIAKLSSI